MTNYILFPLFLLACLVLPLLFYSRNVIGYLKARRRRKEFGEFEDSLVGERGSEKFFSGDVKLEQEVTVLMPEISGAKNDLAKIADAVVVAFQSSELGDVLRIYPTGNGCGIDVMLFDFVNGVALLRATLQGTDAPQGSLIEYSRGDLMIYDQ